MHIVIPQIKALLDEIVETTCATIQNDDGGMFQAPIRFLAARVCPTAKQNIAIMKGLMAEMKDTQMEVMDSFADFARAKVSEMAARDLSKVMRGV